MYKYLTALIVYFVCTLLMLLIFYNRVLISNFIGFGIIFIYFAIAVVGGLLVLKLKKM